MKRTKRLSLIALLISSNIVLARLVAIRTSIVMIDFAFVTIIFASILLNKKDACLVASLGDILGSIFFPTGAYFVGFTITACLTGLVYGMFLSNKEFVNDKKFKIKLLISITLVTILLNGCLNTLWLFIILKKASLSMLPTRITKQLIMIPITYITIIKLEPYIKKIETWCYSD